MPPLRTYSQRQSPRKVSQAQADAAERGSVSSSGRNAEGSTGKRERGVTGSIRKRRKIEDVDEDHDDQRSESLTELSSSGSGSKSHKPARTYSKKEKVNVLVAEGKLAISPSKTSGLQRQSTLLVESKPFPKTPPKDLSMLFNAVSSDAKDVVRSAAPGSPTNRGLAKRMLSRSRTDSSIELSPSSQESAANSNISASLSFTEGVTSKLASASKDLANVRIGVMQESPTRPRLSRNNSNTPSKEGKIASSSNGSKRTYAGASRSFLVALPFDPKRKPGLVDDNPFTASEEEDEFSRESYTELRKRWGVDNSEDDPSSSHQADDTDSRLNNALSSITALRSKGESRRFLDDLGYLFEGLASSKTIGVRRSSAVEIVTKMSDAEFMKKAKAADFIQRAWSLIIDARGGTYDSVLDTSLALFATFVADDRRDVTDLSEKEGSIPCLLKLLSLNEEDDPLICASAVTSRKGKGALGKPERLMLGTLVRLSRQALDIPEGDEVTVSLLASAALRASPVHVFDSMGLVVDGLNRALKRLQPPETASLKHASNNLAILDAFLLHALQDPVGGEEQLARVKDSRGTLDAGLLALMDLVTESMYGSSELVNQTTVTSCLEDTLRVLINLTDDDEEWCQSLVQQSSSLRTLMRLVMHTHRVCLPKPIKQEDPGESMGAVESRALDHLCLALALLTNLIQGSSDTGEKLYRLRICEDCVGSSKASPSCTYSDGSISAIMHLVSVYKTFSTEAHPDQLSVVLLRGHMAVLLGLLMRDSVPAQTLVLQKLPGSSRREKLDSLIGHTRDFASFYLHMSKHAAQSIQLGGESATASNGAETLTESIQSSHTSASDERCALVAKDIMHHLQNIRDNPSLSS